MNLLRGWKRICVVVAVIYLIPIASSTWDSIEQVRGRFTGPLEDLQPAWTTGEILGTIFVGLLLYVLPLVALYWLGIISGWILRWIAAGFKGN